MSLSLSLPFPPSVNGSTFNAKFGRGKTKRYDAWITAAGYELNRQAGSWRCTGEWSLEIRCVRPDKRKRDIDNLIKGICDLLVRHRIVKDDSDMRSVSARWVSADQQSVPCRVFVFSHEQREL